MSCRRSSSSRICAATCTRTRRGRTARTRSRTWSPRRSSRGYAYYAICDHSQRLRGELLHQQSEQIDALNELVAPFRILKGIEVNIRPDGTLDVSDEELATRDWVVASVHSRFDHDPTGRVLAAMESPYVDCIGHLTNRKIGKRAPAPSTSSA